MIVIRRRRVGRSPVVSIAATALVAIVAFGMSARAQVANSVSPQQLGVLTMQHINQVELEIKKQRGQYVSWEELVASSEFRNSSSRIRQYLNDSSISGYETHFELSGGGRGYVVLLVNSNSGYAVKSDDTGVILIGSSVDPRTSLPSLRLDHFRGGALVGKPKN